jgi:DNA mismatch repair protein MutS
MASFGNNQEDFQHTPMMEQYLSLKNQYKDCILFFRMGDFYEMFDDDATIASAILNIVLTKKSAGRSSIPMCGIPYHSYESYLNRLVKAGYKVAICEQLETPEQAKKRGYKAIVNRDVVRIVTSATAIEESLLESDSYNYLLSIFIKDKLAYISWLDVSSCQFFVDSLPLNQINNLLYKINPKEIIVSKDFDISLIQQDLIPLIYSIDDVYKNHNLVFNHNSYEKELLKIYNDKYPLLDIFNKQEQQVIYLLLSYLIFVYKKLDFQLIPKKQNANSYLQMDSFTRKSLELTKNNLGGKTGTLKSVIDYTLTTFGSRLLNQWIENPLLEKDKIIARLDVVDFFVNKPNLLTSLRNIIKEIPDIQRIISRILMNKGNARDLFLIRKALKAIAEIKFLLINTPPYPALINDLLSKIDDYNNLYQSLLDALNDDEELYKKDGEYLKLDFNATFNYFKNQEQNLLNKINELQQIYVARYGIGNLKIVYNGIVGYCIEISIKHISSIKEDDKLKHRQTLSNVARYSTLELESLSNELNQLKINLENTKNEILQSLYDNVIKYADSFFASIEAIGNLDILFSFAFLSQQENLVRPIVDDSKTFNIKEGRHCVVEDRLKKSQINQYNKVNNFIPNNCNMDEGNIFLITGPNMSGKSTFLRQNALLIVLAQIGCFVPAKFAHIGVCDAIYSRVGASDDLFKGQSTFMVEMLELSVILNCATEKSFLILDEIGRGTSTYDGLSIAWATLEYINNKIKSRTLFATHYHELVDLEKQLQNVICYCVNVAEDGANIVFLYEIIKGFISKSYGVEVAKLAGLPREIIKKSYEILNKLENKNKESPSLDLFSLANLSSMPMIKDEELIKNPLEDKIKNLDIDSLSPKEALNILYDMKKALLS